MLSLEEEMSIVAIEIRRLKKTIETAVGEDATVLEIFIRIDEFCRFKRDSWKRVNSSGGIDAEFLVCSDLIASDAVSSNSTNEFLWQKIISVLSLVLDCVSPRPPIGLLYGDAVDRIVDQALCRPDHEKDNVEDDGLLEARYSILEILIKDLWPKFRLLERIRGAFEAAFLSSLTQAIFYGKTKIVAKLCSSLFEEILSNGHGDAVPFLKQLGSIFVDDSRDNDERSTLESRCVGFYCATIILKKLGGESSALEFMSKNELLINLISSCLTSDKIFVRKCGRRLISSLFCDKNDSLDSKAWENFLTLMETLELKQIHVVKPAFGLLDNLVQHCEARPRAAWNHRAANYFGVPWLLFAYQNAMLHPNACVIKWAVGKYFRMDSHSLPSVAGENCKFLFDVVLPVLDRSDAYHRFSEEKGLPPFLSDMERFFRGLISSVSPGIFWRNWLRALKEYSWAPVPLFYASHILSEISDGHEEDGIFNSSDLDQFRSAFWEFRHVPIPFVRAAIQESNVKILLNLCNWNEAAMLAACSKVFSLVPPELIRPKLAQRYCRREGNYLWLANDTFIEKLYEMAPRSNEMEKDDVYWSLEAFRALVAISSHGFSSISAQSLFLREMDNTASTSESGDNLITDQDIRNFTRCLLLLTCLAETRQGAFLLWASGDSGKELKFTWILDRILRIVCQGEGLCTNDVIVYDRFLRTVPTPEITCAADVFGGIEAAYNNCEAGHVRRYHILIILSCLLERIPQFSSASPNSLGSIERFVASLVLDTNDTLVNFDQRVEPSEWRRILSGFAAAKWKCLFNFCSVLDSNLLPLDAIDWKGVAENGLNAMDIVSGAEDVHCVMECLSMVLPKMPPEEQHLVAEIIKKMHSICYEQRKCDQFIPTVRHCCSAAFQLPLVLNGHSDVMNQLSQIANRFISEAENPSLAYCVSKAIHRSLTSDNASPLLASASPVLEGFLYKTLVQLCCYGNILRKDQKMVYDACELIQECAVGVYECNRVMESDHLASQKTRLYAFHSVLHLLKQSTGSNHLVDHLIDLVCDKLKEFICGATKTGYFANSQCHRVRTRAVQVLLLLEPYVKEYATALRLQQFTLKYLTEQNQQPSVRLLLEWAMARLNLRFANEGLLNQWWEAETYIIENRVGNLCTWMEVLMHTGLCLPFEQRRRHSMECAKRFLPWCTAQNFTVRCCAQTCLRMLWNDNRGVVTEKRKSTADDDWTMLNEFLTPTILFDKEQRNNTRNVEKASKDFYFSVFDVVHDYSLETVFHTFPRLCFLPVDELVPVELWQLVVPSDDCLDNTRIRNRSHNLANASVFVWKDRSEETLAEEMNNGSVYESMQTKTNLFPTDNDSLVLNIAKEHDSANKNGLIVVATLVDRPTNLGGLCRTCEIFGASEFAVSSYRVLDDFEFQVLSVSSEKWVKTIEVKPVDLGSHLEKMKLNGYTIVAVEQTTNSRRLTDYQFPAKTLLLLGNEKEGIPVELLQCVDVCVEIPQIGHTRSLNVHVAGALIIWEYSKQHRFNK